MVSPDSRCRQWEWFHQIVDGDSGSGWRQWEWFHQIVDGDRGSGFTRTENIFSFITGPYVHIMNKYSKIK